MLSRKYISITFLSVVLLAACDLLTPDIPFRFKGTVTDAVDGSAIANARVDLAYYSEVNRYWGPLRSTRTDSSGTWSLTYNNDAKPIKPGFERRWLLVFSGDGYAYLDTTISMTKKYQYFAIILQPE